MYVGPKTIDYADVDAHVGFEMIYDTDTDKSSYTGNVIGQSILLGLNPTSIYMYWCSLMVFSLPACFVLHSPVAALTLDFTPTTWQ